jgi:hypothetical protein
MTVERYRPGIDFDAAVNEGKQIIADLEASKNRWLRLGQLADKVEARYGETMLKQFAKEIGIAACTVARARSVFRAYDSNEAPAPPSYAVAQELQAHPDRFALIRNNPNMTKREARRHMRARKRAEQEVNPAGHMLANNERWFGLLVKLSGEIQRQCGIVDSGIEPELERSIRQAVDRTLLPDLREAGALLIRLADRLEQIAAPPARLEAAE